MRTHRGEWCRSVLSALVAISVSVTGLVQAQDRITNRNRDFDDVNRLIKEGSGNVPGFGIGRHNTATPHIDLDRIDRQALMNLLTESISESENLYRAMQKDYQRYPEIRTLMTNLLGVRARASNVAQDLQAKVSLERIQPQLKQLSSDWQLLSHQMSQARQLSTVSKNHISRIDGLQRNLEKLFQMDPQLDRRALLLEMSRLTSSLYNLVQELELDHSGASSLYQLIHDVRKLNQQATRVQNLVVDQHPYSSVVPEYNRFEQQWEATAPRLRQLNNRYVERSIRSIIIANTHLHDLLWLEQNTSRENLKQMADALSRDVDEFFNRVPLKLLLRFKNVNRILETSDIFYGTVQNLKDCLARNEDDQTLLDCYRYVEEYGNVFVKDYSALRSSAGRLVLKEIEDGIVALRNELHLAGTVTSVDTAAMIPTAAGLENLADHLDFDVKQWLNRDRPTFKPEALQASARFVARCRGIHDKLEARPTARELKTEIDDLIEEWRAIYQFLGRCNTEHREHLRTLSLDISQTIYELRAPLEI